MVRGKKFVVMPYVLRNNNIVNIAEKNWSPDQYLAQLKAEFDQLYEEGGSMRRMMNISLYTTAAEDHLPWCISSMS